MLHAQATIIRLSVKNLYKKKIKYNTLYTSRNIAHLHLPVTSERWVPVVTMWFGGYKSSMYET
jgi:hypothetical protein